MSKEKTDKGVRVLLQMNMIEPFTMKIHGTKTA